MTGNGAAERWTLAILVTVVVLSALLRLSGVWFGYPLALHPDEGRIVKPALRMITTGDLNPHFFSYPSLTIYLQAGLFKAADALGFAAHGGHGGGDPNISFYVLGRILTVMMALGTIVVTFFVGCRLIGLAAGLAAAVFVGASTLHTLNSFTITVDVPMALWSSLAVLMAARMTTGARSMVNYLLGGLFVGLAVGSKYTAFLCFVPLLIGHILGRDRQGALVDRRLMVALAIIPVAFLLTTPFAVLDFSSFGDAIVFESKHYGSGHFGFEAKGFTSVGLYARVLVEEGLGWVGACLAVVGLGWLTFKKPGRALLVVSFPLLLLLFVGQYKVFFARNVVAAVPSLAVLSGAGVSFLLTLLRPVWSRVESRPRVANLMAGGGAALLVVVGVCQPLGASRESIRVQTLPDSRWVSLRWIDENISAGSSLCRERYTPPVQHLGGGFRVKNLGFFALTKKNVAARMAGCDYVILSSFNFDRFLDDSERYPNEAAAYQRFFSGHDLIQEFNPDSLVVGGPRILVYAAGGHETERSSTFGEGSGSRVQ